MANEETYISIENPVKDGIVRINYDPHTLIVEWLSSDNPANRNESIGRFYTGTDNIEVMIKDPSIDIMNIEKGTAPNTLDRLMQYRGMIKSKIQDISSEAQGILDRILSKYDKGDYEMAYGLCKRDDIPSTYIDEEEELDFDL